MVLVLNMYNLLLYILFVHTCLDLTDLKLELVSHAFISLPPPDRSVPSSKRHSEDTGPYDVIERFIIYKVMDTGNID